MDNSIYMMVSHIATTFAMGAIELWIAIPLGIKLGLHPVMAGISGAIGAIAGVLGISVVGNSLRQRIIQRIFGGGGKPTPSHIRKIFESYGVVGLGIAGPVLVGAPLATALGIALGAKTMSLAKWTAVGIILWSIVFALVAAFGLQQFISKNA